MKKKYNYSIEKPNMLEGFTEVEKGVIELEEIEEIERGEKMGNLSNIEVFKKELEHLINHHSIENLCDMPDFLIAEMMIGIIQVVGTVSKKNLGWHGCDSVCHPKVDGEECECLHNHGTHTLNWKPKEPNESLDEKFFREHDYISTYSNRCKTLAEIAKEHYQEHPEDCGAIPTDVYENVIKLYQKKGMVSIDDCIKKLEELRNAKTTIH